MTSFILPILRSVLLRTGIVFRRDGLPMRLGLAVVIATGTATLWGGLDGGRLTRLSSPSMAHIEQELVDTMDRESSLSLIAAAHAAPEPVLSGPIGSLLGARQWLNTPPLQPEALRGKVVLVNFWTYSCINCLRVLPHVRAWAEKYKDRGLVVVGVHTPEFAFEKDAANVRKAVTALGVGYPVAIDSDFAIWRAFHNQAWPALYFVGADGRIGHQVLGEGKYEQSEQLIQQLLSEASSAPVARAIVPIVGEGPQAAADEAEQRSGETYVGYAESTNFASPGGVKKDVPTPYRAASTLSLNLWSLAGVWTVGGEFATLNVPSGGIAYRFHARDLHLVMGPSAPDHPVRFRITIDGAEPGADHGTDVDAEGWGIVRDGRLYQLVRQTGAIKDRTFEIEFLDAGVRAYAFTFG